MQRCSPIMSARIGSHPAAMLRITQEGARLFAETGDYARQELYATDDQTFVAKLVDWHLRFAADGVEQAQSVLFHRDDVEMQGTREV